MQVFSNTALMTCNGSNLKETCQQLNRTLKQLRKRSDCWFKHACAFWTWAPSVCEPTKYDFTQNTRLHILIRHNQIFSYIFWKTPSNIINQLDTVSSYPANILNCSSICKSAKNHLLIENGIKYELLKYFQIFLLYVQYTHTHTERTLKLTSQYYRGIMCAIDISIIIKQTSNWNSEKNDFVIVFAAMFAINLISDKR